MVTVSLLLSDRLFFKQFVVERMKTAGVIFIQAFYIY